MKNLLLLILSLTATVALAGRTGDDSWQIGNPTSAFDKKLIFDTGDGSSNKYWLLDHTTKKLSSNVDQITFGSGAAANQSLIFNRGGSNPAIRWNESNSVLEFSNDGSSYVNIGSGSGGSSGLNLITTNPDFEQSLALGWTATGLSFTAAPTAPNLLFGKQSAVVDSSATSQTLDSDLYLIPIGLRSAACAATIYYLGGDSTYNLQVIDGASAVVASQALPTSHPFVQPFSVTFQCPSSGSIKLRIASTANGAPMAIDRMFLGELALQNISQASLLGATYSDSVVSGGNCQVDYGTSVGSWQDPVSNACTFAYQGQAVALSSPLVGFTAPVGPGTYHVEFDGLLNYSAGGGNPACRVVDDLGNFIHAMYQQDSSPGNAMIPTVFQGNFVYTSSRQATFKVQCEDLAVTSNHLEFYRVSDGAVHLTITKFPSSSQLAYSPATTDYTYDFNFDDSTGVIYTPASTSSAFANITDSTNLSLIANPSSLQAFISCTGSGDNIGAGCTSGNPDMGAIINVLRPGLHKVEFDMSHCWAGSASAGYSYEIVETANGSQTVLQTIKSSIDTGNLNAGIATQVCTPLHIQGILNFTNAGRHTVRVLVNGSSSLAGTSSYWQVNSPSGIVPHLTIRPITQQIPVPVLIHSVVSESGGVEKIVRVHFGGAGTYIGATGCTADPCTIYDQSGGVSVINRTGNGSYTVNFAAGTFSGYPTCTCTTFVGGNGTCSQDGAPVSILSVPFRTIQTTTGNPIDTYNNVICIGPK